MPYEADDYLSRHFQTSGTDLARKVDELAALAAPGDSPNLALYREMLFTVTRMAQADRNRWDAKIMLQTLREMEHAFSVLEQFKRRRKVTVFGSARTPVEHPVYALARKLGEELARYDLMVITGAGGAFGAMLKITPLGDYLGSTLSALGIGLFMPFVVAAALKTAQGSTTVALVTTSALVAPLLPQLGLDSEMGRVLTVMAIGAGAMTVSHANDSFFWVVTQFSRMTVSTAYRAQTLATLVQGIAGMLAVWLLSLVLL